MAGSFLFLSALSYAQGIQFTEGSWNEALAKAKSEHKLIYMDIYTTWCGPCKIMAAQIFPAAEAGEKYNGLFVNYKIDAEKGEGITLAKKYQVEGYPTNLYINPEDESVVYRVMGSTGLPEFLNRADIALLEQKDPMKWGDYEQKFEKGARDKAFLVAYIEKAKRLDVFNDKALNAYVEQYAGKKPDEVTLKFLVENTKTFDNKSVAIIAANKERVNKLFPEHPAYFNSWSQMLPYTTLQKAIENKDEKLLALIEKGIKDYGIKQQGVSDTYYYKKEFYQRTGNEEKAWQASKDEADYIAAIKPAAFDKLDAEGLEDVKASLVHQLKAMGVTEDKFESSISATLAKNPDLLKPATTNAAQSLNASAWNVVESKGEDKAAVLQALIWSKKSLELAEGFSSWPLFADTYAHLLFLNGEKNKAIAMQEEAISKAKASQMQGIEGLQESLEKMKSNK